MNDLGETDNTKGNAGWRTTWALVSCALILACGICLHTTQHNATPSLTPARTTTPQAIQTLIDSILHPDSAAIQRTSTWTRHTLCDAFTISIPPTLEKREPWHKYTKNLPYQANADVIFQQKGLSNMTDEAMGHYCRVLISHCSRSPDDEETLRYYETEPIDADMRSLLREMAKAECAPHAMIGAPTYKWIDINGVKALETKYRRRGVPQDFTTAVAIYLLFNYDEMAKIGIEYREQERDLWQTDLDYVIQTFRWKQLNR